MSKMWIYDGMMYVYTLSLLCHFSGFVEKKRRAKQLGTGLLVFVWILQTFFFVQRLIERNDLPVISMFETLFFISWLFVTVALLIHLFLRMDMLLIMVNATGFVFLGLGLFSDREATPTLAGWDVADELLFIHITLAIASYAAFFVSALLSGMYLFLHRRLKRKKWTKAVRMLPDLGTIDRYSSRFAGIGAPLLALSLALGIIWVVLIGHLRLLYDVKVINSLLILTAYAFYFVQRLARQAPQLKLAWWNLAAFAFIIANFIVSNYLSRFHQWIWM